MSDAGRSDLLEVLEGMTAEKAVLIEKEYIASTLIRVFPRLQWTNEGEAKRWARACLIEIVPFFSGVHAAFYRIKPRDSQILEFLGGYALRGDAPTEIRVGETPVGQAAFDGRPLILKEAGFVQSSASMELRPAHLAIIPLMYENRVEGVLEIAALQVFEGKNLEILKGISAILGLNLYALRNFENNLPSLILQPSNPQAALKSLFFDSSAQPLALLDQELNVLEANPAWNAYLSDERSNLSELFHPSDAAALDYYAFSEKRPMAIQQRVKTHSGKYEYAAVRILSQKDGFLVAIEPLENEGARFAELNETLQYLERRLSLLEGILEHTHFLVYVKDGEGRFLHANQPLLKQLGLELGNVIDKTNHEIFPAELADIFLEKDREVLESGETRLVLDPTFDLHGEPRRLLSLNFPLKLSGDTRVVAGVALDVTGIPLESFLDLFDYTLEIETLRAMVNSLPDLLLLVDADLNLITANQAYIESENYFGRKAAWGKNVLETIPENEVERWRDLFMQALKGERIEADFYFAPYEVKVCFYPIALRKKVTYVTVFVQEISEFKQRLGEVENVYQQVLNDWRQTLAQLSETQKANQELTIYSEKLERLVQSQTLEMQSAREGLELLQNSVKAETTPIDKAPDENALKNIDEELSVVLEQITLLGAELSYHARAQFLALARKLLTSPQAGWVSDDALLSTSEESALAALPRRLPPTIDLSEFSDLFSLYNAPAIADALLKLVRLKNKLVKK